MMAATAPFNKTIEMVIGLLIGILNLLADLDLLIGRVCHLMPDKPTTYVRNRTPSW
jgi:hypothetical protein